jgi:nucleoid-associated protein YgaU
MTNEQINQSEETDDVSGFNCGYFNAFYMAPRGAYMVQPGDTLFAIAQRTYGDGRMWPFLFATNSDRIANPNLIYPGQVLRIG